MNSATSFRSFHQTLVLTDLGPMERLRLLLQIGCPASVALDCASADLPSDRGQTFAHSKPDEGTHPWNLVRFLIQCVRADCIVLSQAVELLRGYQIHPWSLVWMANHLTGIEVLAWGEPLGLPGSFLAHALDWGPQGDFSAGFSLHGDPALSWIPDGFKVDSLLLRHCPRLGSIGSGFESEGILELINCGLVVTLPEGIRALHFIRIRDCPSFSRLPAAFSTGGLQLSELPFLDRLDLPRDFIGFLEAEDCCSLNSITAWSQHLKRLRVAHCSVQSLPPGLKVEEAIDLAGLPIGAIPPGLQVGGDCRLADLSACTTIGEGTFIAGDLSITNLPSLQALPKDLIVGGKVIVDTTFNPLLLPGHLQDRMVTEEPRD